jgi:hypothetical protein
VYRVSDEGGDFASQVSLAPPPAPSQSSALLSPSKRYVGAIKSPAVTQRQSYWSEGSPLKRGRMSKGGKGGSEWEEAEESNEETEDEDGIRPGLLFSKGKGAGDMSVDVVDLDQDVIDLDPDEDDMGGEDNMDLDCAVGHMSLDPASIDLDIEVTSGATPAPSVPPPAVSPVLTRARRRAKEAANVKHETRKRASRTRVLGTRTSSRLAALTDVSMD